MGGDFRTRFFTESVLYGLVKSAQLLISIFLDRAIWTKSWWKPKKGDCAHELKTGPKYEHSIKFGNLRWDIVTIFSFFLNHSESGSVRFETGPSQDSAEYRIVPVKTGPNRVSLESRPVWILAFRGKTGPSHDCFKSRLVRTETGLGLQQSESRLVRVETGLNFRLRNVKTDSNPFVG